MCFFLYLLIRGGWDLLGGNGLLASSLVLLLWFLGRIFDCIVRQLVIDQTVEGDNRADQ